MIATLPLRATGSYNWEFLGTGGTVLTKTPISHSSGISNTVPAVPHFLGRFWDIVQFLSEIAQRKPAGRNVVGATSCITSSSPPKPVTSLLTPEIRLVNTVNHPSARNLYADFGDNSRIANRVARRAAPLGGGLPACISAQIISA